MLFTSSKLYNIFTYYDDLENKDKLILFSKEIDNIIESSDDEFFNSLSFCDSDRLKRLISEWPDEIKIKLVEKYLDHK